jgi:hypothetical protein
VSAILFFRFCFYFVFYLSENCFFFIHNFFIRDNSPCRVEKDKEQPPTINVPMLFLLWTSTMMSYQCFQALCAISLVRSHCMLMLSMVLDEDDDDSLLLLYRHHLSLVHNNNCPFLLDSMFMNIEPEDIIPRLLPANRNRTFHLLDNGWCYHHTCFNVCQLQELYHRLNLPLSLAISTKGHKASSEEAFIITVTKLVTGSSNTSLMEVFGVSMDTFISRVFKTTVELLDNKADGVLHGNCLQR